MPERISMTKQGNTIIVWFYAYDEDENLSDLDADPTIEAWKSGLRVLDPATMTRDGIGTYRYNLETSVLSVGDYILVCKGVLQDKKLVEDAPLKVHRPWKP